MNKYKKKIAIFFMKYWIVDEIWREIKSYLFHSIKNGKHLKNDIYIKNYNKTLKDIPQKYIPRLGPRIIWCSRPKNPKGLVKFIYNIPSPSFTSYKLIIEYLTVSQRIEQDNIRELYKKNMLL